MKMESSKMGNIIAGIFLIIFTLVGIAAFIGGFFIQNDNNKFMKTAEKTSAVITDINETSSSRDSDGDTTYNYDVIVSFVVNGVTYKGNLGSYNSDMRVGNSQTIYYNPSNPKEFMSSDADFMGYIIVSVGAIFILGGIFLSVINFKGYKSAKEKEE